MRRFLTAALLAASLAGCAQLREGWSRVETAVTSAEKFVVPTKTVVVGAEAFDGMQSLAAIYVRLPRCTGSNGPSCSYYVAKHEIDLAIAAGRSARDSLKRFLRAHPGQLGSQGLYDAVNSTTQTIQDVFDKYNVKGATS